MATVDSQIRAVCATISDTIEALEHDRNLLSRNAIKQLRDLAEAIAVRLQLQDGEAEFHYDQTGAAVEWIGSTNKDTNFIYRFHRQVQMSASHYSFEGDAAERLMLKYYEYLLRARILLLDRCGLDVLGNLERFPLHIDPALSEYHAKIAERIAVVKDLPPEQGNRSRYYVHSVRPFFTGGLIFYEVTFSNISDRPNKFDRIIAFTDIDMTDRYAAQLRLVPDQIQMIGQSMPIMIIRSWDVSIRPCEFQNFAKIFGLSTTVDSGSSEYMRLMRFLTETSHGLVDLMLMGDTRYEQIKGAVVARIQKPQIMPVLDAARQLVHAKSAGHNVVRYLLLEMRNRVIKEQYELGSNRYLSGLQLTSRSGPFDTMPFCAMPAGHVTNFRDLMASVDPSNRRHEFLARRIRNNVERHGLLYTPIAEVQDLGELDDLVAVHNATIPPTLRHAARTIEQDKDHVFMHGYEDSTVAIIERLQQLSAAGVAGYDAAADRWLGETRLDIDDEVKKTALRSLFAKSCVALIYGAAGTGKSTMVGYIADYFSDKQLLFLAHTHSAKDNLERKAPAPRGEYRTIGSHIKRSDPREYDVLVIDECSIVSNDDLLAILAKTKFKLLVLVGDLYQIASIQFGNWFNVIRGFVPKSAVFELTKPHRTNSVALLDFWSKVRHLDDGIEESIAHHGYAADLDKSLFDTQQDGEIILCLNYDGLYGINNVNRFRQSSNPGKPVVWGLNTYKVGDPVLFNQTDRFNRFIYNNLKGRIVDIVVHEDRIQFDVWLDRGVTAIDVDGHDLRYVRDSTVSFDVYQRGNTDNDDETVYTSVPFQIAYAVSIHKAQGLEYDSVKIVITDANEEDISHNIFYTAITRARKQLKIHWSPETQKSVLETLEHSRSGKDVALLKARRGVVSMR
ncbi:ATP-dependent DNA helicase [Mycetocola zhujimingii]|uniref:Helicase n=1 Tax=Mycetocola zhujimingii TaxID=2079792 RepID=A0A2U1TD07_9MICO|nr:ATP-dependent RecD-like DNA helicase [Mycetocola zhujimingii]PWC06663.1 helicase [Mycetocola zhujimingii]